MAVTYSQSATIGLNAGSPFAVLSGTPRKEVLPDTAANLGGQQNAMMTGTQVLALFPDGSKRYCTIDAERSRPPAYIVLVPVGP